MKLHSVDLPFGKNQNLKNTTKVVLLIGLAILFTSVPLYYPLLTYPVLITRNLSRSSSLSSSVLPFSSSSSSSSYDVLKDQPTDTIRVGVSKKCDIFKGEWIPNPGAPYYTNTTCWAIHEHQNCMKYGRPDTDFLKWRWKPNDCELPIFDPSQFLELVRGKSMAFVGDSVARNQMQSLVCLLSRVEYPVDVSYSTNELSMRWKYTNYNFTIENFWSPYLVKVSEADPNGPAHTGLFNLYLDEFDDWTTKVHEFNYVIISAGHWFFRSLMFYENSQLVGCHYCLDKNITDLSFYYGYRKAFRTAFRAINSLKNYKGITFLRTFAPSHYENGLWNEGGNCVRKRPFRGNETHLDARDLELYMTQLEEFKFAEGEGVKKGLKFRLLDTTQATLMRPDGHPSKYGHRTEENVTVYNDCVHWCLPGPIDTWNDFLLEMLKIEQKELSQGSL